MLKCPTKTRLRAAFEYQSDGYLVWRVSNFNQIKIGQRAGTTKSCAYRRVTFNGVKYLEHRLIYIYHFGGNPRTLDHINRNKHDNRIENLRLATSSQNGFNQGIRKDNTSGYRGVSLDRGRWFAQISVRGKMRKLGYFSTAKEASIKFQTVSKEIFKEFA